MRRLVSVIVGSAWISLAGTGAEAQQACLQQARNSYEKLYCQIKADGEGAGLPSLADFRRNPPETQALLLRRPASRLGLSLPPRDGASNPSQDAPVADDRSVSVAPEDAGIGPSQTTPLNKEDGNRQSRDCVLSGDIVRCGGSIFSLVTNQANVHLDENALTETNRLILRPYQGATTDEAELRSYLIGAYETYLEKMLEIGLGASTMSFTKFYYTHQALQEQGADFSQRMETMFDYLKQDKRTMAIRQRYTDRLPTDIEQCDRLGERLMVCDEGEVNWVYKRHREL